MRLIHAFHNDQDARTLAAFLTKRNIETHLELDTNTDWGSDEYGNILCRLWAIEEEDANEANKWLKIFLQDPHGPLFSSLRPQSSLMIKSLKDSLLRQGKKTPASKPTRARGAPLTFYTVILCVLLLLFSGYSSDFPESMPKGLSTPIFSSPIKQALFYDYPHAYELVHKLIATYGYKILKDPGALPREGYALLIQSQQTPLWGGLYEKIVGALTTPEQPITFHEPMFEKIQRGEVWRLVTPAFLHAGAFHLLFNMLWLIVLGSQMEQRLGWMRYLLFILVAAAFSNTAQYLMNGPNFLGFSGVICGMILFVWIRQKNAPWEGYHLLPPTMLFISIMILGLATLQVFSFVLEIAGHNSVGTGIANTAHLSGALAGYLLAQLKFFQAK